ncbi:acyl carrier protein [Herbaspirillum sp. RU 5E]|jgi:acyl carrier protein|uniref:acyl carrier protein n=1 Tax=Herbaspirillum sp. CAH-3 TaxID=2605746 RepID=UPI0012AC9715|nr:acyl carrier protein [Herbaspirillum sp. CAH-3]MBW9332829.1 acyl carrier protein [Herbaspirillum sp. RU 5E]MRT30641.1 acyl carrier protein [Herbaspirillum sp. CAH-3]
MDKFYDNLADLLEVDAINPDQPLDEYENWDSLTVISFIASLDADYGVNMTAKDIAAFATAGDLFAEVQRRKTK